MQKKERKKKQWRQETKLQIRFIISLLWKFMIPFLILECMCLLTIWWVHEYRIECWLWEKIGSRQNFKKNFGWNKISVNVMSFHVYCYASILAMNWLFQCSCFPKSNEWWYISIGAWRRPFYNCETCRYLMRKLFESPSRQQPDKFQSFLILQKCVSRLTCCAQSSIDLFGIQSG